MTIAEELAKKQREISISEFFERNKQILGYDSPTKAVLTVVKEAVDNSVEHDEPVLVRQEGRVRFVRIGEYVDHLMEREGVLPDASGRSFVTLSDCEVLAYDDSTLKMRWKPASGAQRHPLRGDLYEVELVGGRKVTVTGSHSVFGLAGKRIAALRVADLRVGDYVVVPHRELAVDDPIREVDLRPWLLTLSPDRASGFMIHGMAARLDSIPRDWTRFDFVPLSHVQKRRLEVPRDARVTVRFGKSRLPVVIPVTEALMRFLGLYAAEGTRSRRIVTLSFGAHETDLIDDARRCVLEAFGPETRLSKVPAHETAVCLKIYSGILCEVLNEVFGCGDHAHEKRVPDLVFNVEPELQLAFLGGYIAGDGYRGREKISMTTVSPDLAAGLTFLFALRGKAFSITKKAAGFRVFPRGYVSQTRPAYSLYLYGSEGLEEQPNSPLNWFPLGLTGFLDVVSSMRPLSSYNVPLYKDMWSRPHYTIGKFAEALVEAEEYAREDLPSDMRGQKAFLERLIFGDLSFLRVKAIRKVESPHPYVYDFSVPGSEKFLGGRGVLFLHNTLDACEEAEILPDVSIEVRKGESKDEFVVAVEDNGPGILKKEVANVFGRLLYGSRFHSRRQARGAQGLGISGAIMYGQITTGKPATIRTKTAEMDVAYELDLIVDTRKNKPSIQREEFKVWDKAHGTRIEIPLKGRYIGGKQSVTEYLKGAAIVNPHARLSFKPPEGEVVVWERATQELPPKTVEIKPHPYGLEIGTLLAMGKETKSYKLSAFLEEEFSRISPRVAKEICELAEVDPETRPKSLSLEQAKAIVDAIPKVKVMAPQTDCLAPIGERLIKKGLKNVLGNLRPEFYSPPLTRDPAVWQGNPFQVEVGIVFGGDLPADQPVEVLRFANRAPLLYQAGACALAQAAANVDWRRYGLEQRGGQGLPYGPAILLLHVCSTKVPYTNEAKEAVSAVPEILTELDLALKEVGRRLKTHLTKKERKVKTREKFDIVQKILPLIAQKSATIVGKKVPSLDGTITKIMGVVWIEESVAYDKKHVVTIDVHNFTAAGKKMNLHALLPRNGWKLGKVRPKPTEVREDGKITWELPRIGSVEKATVTFELLGLEKDEYDETDLYVSGIPPDLVIGAEPLPGDWELNYKEFEQEEAPPAVAEEEEVDYDETEEELGDE